MHRRSKNSNSNNNNNNKEHVDVIAMILVDGIVVGISVCSGTIQQIAHVASSSCLSEMGECTHYKHRSNPGLDFAHNNLLSQE